MPAIAPSTLGSRRAGAWNVQFADDPSQASVNAARLSATDGCVGSQSISEIGCPPGLDRAVRVAGLYGPEPPGLLLSGPAWTPVGWTGEGLTWSLDMATGTVTHRLRLDGTEVETRRWAMAGHPGSQVYVAPTVGRSEVSPSTPRASVLIGADGTAAVTAVADRRLDDRLQRVATTVIGDSTSRALAQATTAAQRLVEREPSALVADQDRRWADRWSRCRVSIDGDPRAELRTRFVLFQLLALTDHREELPIGARGLTGEGYGGHVFWDADTFVLPSLASVAPSAARAMIEYRLQRLGSARDFARADGHPGARFPWESAASGIDVTPRWGARPAGEPVAIRTGQQELHIGSDIALAVQSYRRWTGDDRVLESGAAEATIEIARYWASRITTDDDGRGHLNGVIGPDEYHEDVDDNAFTNRMAAWTLREASRLAATDYPSLATEAERTTWSRVAASIDLGYDASRGRHRQFAGYDRLDPILAATIAEPPFAADLLLGSAAVQRSQLIKQADVVMMHHLIPDDMPAGSLDRDLAYYLPRTAHGSSLSPSMHAAVLARAGRPDEALRWYDLALALDLDDLTQTGSGGLHYANLGGTWQALLAGFLGIRPRAGGLVVDPNLPLRWDAVRVGFLYRGMQVEIEAEATRAKVETEAPVSFLGPEGADLGTTENLRLTRTAAGWVAS